MSPRQINILKDEIKRLLDLGGIELGQSDFTSPLILVGSPNRDPGYGRMTPKWNNTHIVFPFAEHAKKTGWRRTICDGLSRLEWMSFQLLL
ncbi:hypothetical protein TNIN_265871 [Trichonephila inaurata madagascariensis]|uniref:Uncharacterized protein n=1 Tax=Trichonephila inaurata madagascariensis TaxID=2747483 RepID=A0A8X6MBZ8_9ARAC|nr:hypothetical protein TNIN_265871 [Trichonephila inaurata madagascariensis]